MAVLRAEACPMRRLVLLALCLFLAAPAQADEDEDFDHAGYYYPFPATSELFRARAPLLPGSDRGRRVAFVTALTAQALRQPYPPGYAVFAKGEHAEKLIVVALGPGQFDTLFRMRGLLAILTAQARTTRLFIDLGVEEVFTFFDLAAMIGFAQITVSDGRDWAHRVVLIPRP